MRPASALLLALGLGLSRAGAKSLLIDFGPTPIGSTLLTTSPAHTTGAVPAAEVSWNTGIVSDTNTLVYSDGSTATGVALVLGRSTAGSSTINFSDKGYLSGALGGAINTGIYASGSAVRDGIYGGSGGGNALAIGMRVDGLPAGDYVIYITGRNTSASAAGTPEEFLTLPGTSAGTFVFSTAADAWTVVTNYLPANTTSFVRGDNYGTLAVTLAAGQSLFLAGVGTAATELRGFLNTVEIVPGGSAAKITGQPAASQTVLQGMFAVNLSATYSGTAPVARQWRFNSTNTLAGATNSTLSLSNVTLAMAGSYSLFVSNAYGTDVSSGSVLNVTPVTSTGELTNLWKLLPGDRFYVTSSSTNAERSLAYNPANGNLLIAGRAPTNCVAVLAATNAAEKRFLDTTGIPGSIAGVGLGMNLIGVAADGAVFTGSVTVNATTGSYMLYRWADDSGTAPATVVFAGDPAGSVQPGLRWGDTLAVRGAGAATQILVTPGSGTNVVLLQTPDGLDFQNQIPPVVLPITGASSGFADSGLAFGPGTNTFWAKTVNNQLRLIQFDLNAGTGAVLYAYAAAAVPNSVGALASEDADHLLAGLSFENPDNVRLYGTSDLVAGPTLMDQRLFTVKNANATQNGTGAAAFGGGCLFVLDSNNGIMAFGVNTNAVIPAKVSTQPASQTVLEGVVQATLSAAYQGTTPVACQWRFNGTNLAGATTSSLVLSNVTLAMAGAYSLSVSNAYGTDLSSNAVLTVIPAPNTAQMTNIWSLVAGDGSYLGTGNTERGLAFSAFDTNLLLVSRAPVPSIVALDPATGAQKWFMNTLGVPADVPGVSLGLVAPGVADDGMVYVGSVTVNAAATPYHLYQWADDTSNSVPAEVFSGDPAGGVQPGLRWGDNLAIRGAGTNTQILLAPGSGTNVVLLQTTSGNNFQYEVPPAVIAVTGVPSAFAQLGIAFGPLTNTFWAKTGNSLLYLIQYDLAANTGAVLYAYATNAVPATVRGISTDAAQKFLAGVSSEVPDNARLFDISNLTNGPVQRDEELFTTTNPNTLFGGEASTAIGGGYVFALDSNNGIKAFLINTNYLPPLGTFNITGVAAAPGGSLVLTWQTVAGHSYQVQSKASLPGGSWANVGLPVTASGVSTSFTNAAPAAGFYRVQGQ